VSVTHVSVGWLRCPGWFQGLGRLRRARLSMIIWYDVGEPGAPWAATIEDDGLIGAL
jgi:hypothetical protein